MRIYMEKFFHLSFFFHCSFFILLFITNTTLRGIYYFFFYYEYFPFCFLPFFVLLNNSLFILFFKVENKLIKFWWFNFDHQNLEQKEKPVFQFSRKERSYVVRIFFLFLVGKILMHFPFQTGEWRKKDA